MIKSGKKIRDVVSIPVNQIQPNPNQPRKNFRWEDLEELAVSIRANGLLQPVSVRNVGDGKFQLVAGERRLRASKMAGMAEIPAIVVNISEERSAVLAVIENLQRQDLHFFEEARAIERLARNFGMDRDKIARKLGKSPSAVSNKLRLLKLSPELRDKIYNGGLTERHARALLKIEDEKTANEIVDAVIKNHLNVADTETLVARVIKSREPKGEEKPRQGKKITGIFRDVRIFANTIDHAVETMRKSGITADTISRETEGYIEYVVRIRKQA